MLEVSGGQEVRPLELSIKSLSREIDEESQQITELQQAWLRDQAGLVELCRAHEERSNEVEEMKEKVGF